MLSLSSRLMAGILGAGAVVLVPLSLSGVFSGGGQIVSLDSSSSLGHTEGGTGSEQHNTLTRSQEEGRGQAANPSGNTQQGDSGRTSSGGSNWRSWTEPRMCNGQSVSYVQSFARGCK